MQSFYLKYDLVVILSCKDFCNKKIVVLFS